MKLSIGFLAALMTSSLMIAGATASASTTYTAQSASMTHAAPFIFHAPNGGAPPAPPANPEDPTHSPGPIIPPTLR